MSPLKHVLLEDGNKTLHVSVLEILPDLVVHELYIRLNTSTKTAREAKETLHFGYRVFLFSVNRDHGKEFALAQAKARKCTVSRSGTAETI